jgi:hypothetical protein
MLYLTYNNNGFTDGAGAQIQRIISIYLVAKYYKLGYIHSKLLRMSYQGAKCLENNEEDSTQIERYNSLFTLPSSVDNITFDRTYSSEHLSEELINNLKGGDGNTLLSVIFAHGLVDRKPELLLQSFTLPWIQPLNIVPIVIAVHVRRGELFVVDSDRMLPNSYYINCMKTLSQLFIEANVPYEFHLHTEIISKPTLVTPTHHGITERIKTPVLIKPEDNHIEEFSVIPNIKYRINEDPVETLKALSSANILLASRSSFSYVAAILSSRASGVVLFHPFWHSLSPAWIPVRCGQDIVNAKQKILSACN